MILSIKILSICLLFFKIVEIECNSTTIDPKNDDYESDYDYEDKKLFDVIKEKDLIDALRETEELQKKMNAKNMTEEDKGLNSNVKEQFDSSDKSDEFIKELKKNFTDNGKPQNMKSNLFKKNPFVMGSFDKAELLSRPLMKRLMPAFLPLTDELYESNLSPHCMAALIRLGKGAKEKEVWALKCNDH